MATNDDDDDDDDDDNDNDNADAANMITAMTTTTTTTSATATTTTGEDPFRLGLDGKSLGQRDQSEGPTQRQCRSVKWPFVTSNVHEFP